jgi:predicted RNA binding protein YcfA (HicA-like mRNA interferase family)
MVKPSKLYDRLVASPSSMRFRDFQRVLEAFGFTLDRVKGSHHNYTHPVIQRPFSIQPKGNMAKPYQIDQFLDLVEAFGLFIPE